MIGEEGENDLKRRQKCKKKCFIFKLQITQQKRQFANK